MTSLTERTCLECFQTIRGRTDKKFCCDLCRVAYHNRQCRNGLVYIRTVNNVLRKNRKILSEFSAARKRRITLDNLKAKGFNFDFFTSKFVSKNGIPHYFCYDVGYAEYDNNHYTVLVRKERNTTK